MALATGLAISLEAQDMATREPGRQDFEVAWHSHLGTNNFEPQSS